MITQAHMNTYDITSTLYDITPRYDIHTHCIHVITPRIPVITSTVPELLLTVYWLYHICNMCNIKPTICRISYEFYVTSQQLFVTLKDCIHESHPHYSWHHPHWIWHHIQSACDLTATVTMTIHLLYFWPYTQCIWHLTWWVNNNTTIRSDMLPDVSV